MTFKKCVKLHLCDYFQVQIYLFILFFFFFFFFLVTEIEKLMKYYGNNIAPVGYSIMIVFRAINGSASETVCHTILSSEKGQLDLSKMSSGSDWILVSKMITITVQM